MDGLLDGKGRLGIVLGRGWISAWEASRLAKGAVVMSDSEAGDSAEISFEGRRLGRGEICVIGDGPGIVALRVSGLEREAGGMPERERGEYLAEVLPFEILVAETSAYSLSDLAKVGVTTIISFDEAFAYPTGVELRVAGRTAGRGRAAVAGERLSILLDEAEPSGGAEPEAFSTGTVLPPGAGQGSPAFQLYDFRRPDQFTSRVIGAIASIHRRLAESLAARRPGLSGMRVKLVDQLTWGEWLAGARSPAQGPSLLWRTRMGRPDRSYERQARPPAGGLALLKPASPRLAIPAEIESLIASWTAEEDSRLEDRACFIAAPREEGKDKAPGSAAADAEAIADIVAAMKAAWKLVGDATFSPASPLAGPPILSFDPENPGGKAGEGLGLFENELVALVRLEGPAGRLDLVYSARALYPLTKALESYARFAPQA